MALDILKSGNIDSVRPDQEAWRRQLSETGVTKEIFPLVGLNGQTIGTEIFVPPVGQTLPVKNLLLNSEGYRGQGQAQLMVNFLDLFSDLRGQHLSSEVEWSPSSVLGRGIIELAAHEPRAEVLSRKLSNQALLAVADQGQYNNRQFREKYRILTQAGYQLMNQYEEPYAVVNRGRRPVVILRAGQLATEYTLGTAPDSDFAITLNEKRIHLKGEMPGDVAVELFGMSDNTLARLANQDLLVCDPAHATGSSLLALVIAAAQQGYIPRSVQLRSLAANRKGLDLSQKLFKQMGIDFTAYVLKAGTFLTDRYYLGRSTPLSFDPVVADAGDALYGPNNCIT